MKAWCEANANLTFIRCFDALGDTSGIDSDKTYDGVHLNPVGSWAVADNYVTALIAQYGTGEIFTTAQNDSNLSNPSLTGTSGTTGTGTSGDTADDWHGQMGGAETGITRTFSKTPEGYQRMVIESDGTGATDQYIVFKQDVSGLTVGDTYRGKLLVTVNEANYAYWCGVFLDQENVGGTSLLVSTDMDRRVI